MEEQEVTAYISDNLPGVDIVVASRENGAPEVSWGSTFFMYDPDRNLPDARKFPFATIVNKDYGDFDSLSNLDRPGVFRLNIGVSKETYDAMFGATGAFDFAELDRVMPHPVYGSNHWVCVLNPSEATFETVEPLLTEAYRIAVSRAERPRKK